MNAQEYYDLLVTSAESGVMPGVEVVIKEWCQPFFSCRYRTADGKKCAAGVLIPDTMYESYYEGNSASAVLGALGNKFKTQLEPAEVSTTHLNYIQGVHDTTARAHREAAGVDGWNEERQKAWAAEFIRRINEVACFEHCVKKETPGEAVTHGP